MDLDRTMKYIGLVSSDWNECLAPTGPFDPVAYLYPELKKELNRIFKSYTSNEIPLSLAVSQINGILPKPFSPEQMDAYLDASFAIYNGVVEMIETLASRNILFMINTTGAQGFFQRIIDRKLIPPAPIVASNPFIKFAGAETDPRFQYQVLETADKASNTDSVMKKLGLTASKVVIIGDSGGDGPHFAWGSSAGACLVGSMTKTSLTNYCRNNQVNIDRQFGIVYRENQARDLEVESRFDFRELGFWILERLT